MSFRWKIMLYFTCIVGIFYPKMISMPKIFRETKYIVSLKSYLGSSRLGSLFAIIFSICIIIHDST